MAYTLISHAWGANGFQSAVLDNTGCDFMVAVVAAFSSPSISNNQGDSWNAGISIAGGGGEIISLFWISNPTINAAYSINGGGVLWSVTVQAWSGSAVSPYDQQAISDNGLSSTGTSGTVTPTTNNQLLVPGMAFYPVGLPASIDSGFTISDTQEYTAGNCCGIIMAYKIQTSAGTESPTTTFSNVVSNCGVIATFKAASGGGSATPSKLPILGVG